MTAQSATKYSWKYYKFPPELVAQISVIESRRTYLQIALIWFFVLIFSAMGRLTWGTEFFWVLYAFLGFLIAGRQGALLQIVHEAAHYLISEDSRTNDFVGNWMAGLPVGLTVEGYRNGHMKHHSGTNTEEDLDTDLEKYSVVDLRDPALYVLFLRDIFGITALKSFFGHNHKSLLRNRAIVHTEIVKGPASLLQNKFVRLAISQMIVLGFIFQFDFMFYVLLWALPLISFNMVLLRVRGITEHGAPNQMQMKIESSDQGNRYTRSVMYGSKSVPFKVLNFVERSLIGSLCSNFHHEHHLLPKVPFYNLKYINEHIAQDVRVNQPHVFVKSYFLTLFHKNTGNA